MQKRKIFVYGTLKSDEYNHDVLKEVKAKYLTVVRSVETYPMFELRDPFPYLQDKPGIGVNIIGEMYEVPEEAMAKLDMFEGVPTLYKRGTIKVTDGSMEHELAVYFKAKELTDRQLNMLVMLDTYKSKPRR